MNSVIEFTQDQDHKTTGPQGTPADPSPETLAVRSPSAILAQTTVRITTLSYSLLFNSNSQECAGTTAETSVVTGSID